MVNAPVPTQHGALTQHGQRMLQPGNSRGDTLTMVLLRPSARAGISPGPRLRTAIWRELQTAPQREKLLPRLRVLQIQLQLPLCHTPAAVPDVLPLCAQHPGGAAWVRRHVRWGPAHPPYPQTAPHLPPAPS